MSLTDAQKRVLHERITSILVHHVEPLFVKGMELTLVARLPGNDEADCLVTSEPDMRDVLKAVERAMNRPDISPSGSN